MTDETETKVEWKKCWAGLRVFEFRRTTPCEVFALDHAIYRVATDPEALQIVIREEETEYVVAVVSKEEFKRKYTPWEEKKQTLDNWLLCKRAGNVGMVLAYHHVFSGTEVQLDPDDPDSKVTADGMYVAVKGPDGCIKLLSRNDFLTHFDIVLTPEEETYTPCCGTKLKQEEGSARTVVMFNPGNGVVSCHHCGAIYVPGDRNAYSVWTEAKARALDQEIRYCPGRNGTCPLSLDDDEESICHHCRTYYDGWNAAMKALEDRMAGSLKGMREQLRGLMAPYRAPTEIPVQVAPLSDGQIESIQAILGQSQKSD